VWLFVVCLLLSAASRGNLYDSIAFFFYATRTLETYELSSLQIETTNRKSRLACRIMLFSITMSDCQCHASIAGFFKCNFRITVQQAVDKIYTGIAHRTVRLL